jgi:hypothetical protein
LNFSFWQNFASSRKALDEGPRSPGTNEFKQSYWSKALNWSQGI